MKHFLYQVVLSIGWLRNQPKHSVQSPSVRRNEDLLQTDTETLNHPHMEIPGQNFVGQTVAGQTVATAGNMRAGSRQPGLNNKAGLRMCKDKIHFKLCRLFCDNFDCQLRNGWRRLQTNSRWTNFVRNNIRHLYLVGETFAGTGL